MDALPGSRNVAEAGSDQERRSITREYMAAVAAMHRLPLEPFVAIGLEQPVGARDIMLAGLGPYLAHYRRTKSKPEPMLEFVLGWIRRNAPSHRTKASFIQFDSGQFLFKDGRLTGLYDFEFSMIGDPMMDIATMRMRDSGEPLGDHFAAMCRCYEEFSDEPIDDAAVEFSTLLFATLGALQFAGTVGRPRSGDAHDVYLEFDLSLRQLILLALRAVAGTEFTLELPLPERVGHNAALIGKLSDTVMRMNVSSKLEESHKDSAARLIEWLFRADAMGTEMRDRDLSQVSALLGRTFREWPEAEAALESYVLAAGPEQDERLMHLFAGIEGRRVLVFGQTRIGHAAWRVRLPRLR
jgi:hypothetical protein